MLGKKEINTNNIDTLIGKNTKIQGTVEGIGAIRIDGEVIGDLIIQGNVVIGKEGKILGNINCNNLLNSGTVKGNATCNEQFRLTNTGSHYGDVNVKTFIVDENAIFEGKCKMQIESDSKQNKQTSEKSEKKGA